MRKIDSKTMRELKSAVVVVADGVTIFTKTHGGMLPPAVDPIVLKSLDKAIGYFAKSKIKGESCEVPEAVALAMEHILLGKLLNTLAANTVAREKNDVNMIEDTQKTRTKDLELLSILISGGEKC